MYTEGKNCCRAGNAKQGRFRIHRTEQVFDTFIDPLPGQNAAHMGCFAVKSPDILVEGALEMDVHQLRAAADAQHWNVLFHRSSSASGSIEANSGSISSGRLRVGLCLR